MPTRTLSRYDFRLGVNRSFGEDVVGAREVVTAQNARLGARYGTFVKRAGTQRLHGTALASGADILGLYQWDNPGQSAELIAIAGGNLYHKALGDANYTEVSSSLSTTNRPWFAPYELSGTRRLYIADGALRKWTATTLTTSISGAPAAETLAVYGRRLFATDGTKTLYWSAIADPEDWSAGSGTSAGTAQIETYDDEPLVGLARAGASLLLFKENSIARYTGVASENIRIDQESDGIDNEIGCIAPQTIVETEHFVFFLSDRGPYIATEAGVDPVGVKIESDFDDAAQDQLSNAVAVHDRRRREIHLWIPGSGQSENTQGWCWNYRLESWAGPWSLSGFNVCSAAHLELSNGVETVMLGGYDGFVRDGDIEDNGAKDDVASDDTGGTNVTMVIEWPDFVFRDPAAIKTLSADQYIVADLKTNGSLTLRFQGDDLAAQSQTISSDGAGVKTYSVRPGTYGRRIVLRVTDDSDEIVQINGIKLEAAMGRRAG